MALLFLLKLPYIYPNKTNLQNTIMKKLFLAVCMLSLVACNNQQKENEIPATKIETLEEAHSKADKNKSDLDVTLEWVAYKFDDKTGVKGAFTEFDIDYNKEGKTPEEKLSNLTFKIDKESASTDDAARDKTITDNFFLNLKGDIHGSLGELKDGKVATTISMNDKSVTKTFAYEIKDNKVHFKGEVDILEDFMADTAFKALHDACAVLHDGKTWTDVAVEVTVAL